MRGEFAHRFGFRYRYKYPHPAVATDIAIFAIMDRALHILLIERKEDPFRGCWALPGGFVGMDEDLDACARRELLEETNVDAEFLHHFGNFSAPMRDPRERVISVAYLALMRADKLTPIAGSDAQAVGWHSIKKMPALAFDHAEIVAAANAALKKRVSQMEILLHLMPESFTLTEIKDVAETILDKPPKESNKESIDKHNFRARLLSTGLIEKTGGMIRGAHRPAALYRRVKSTGT